MRLPAHRDDPSVEYIAGSLVVGVFFPGVAVGIAYPTLPQLELVLGISPAVVGLIISTTSGVRLLCNAPVGSLFDRVGTRQPLIVGFVLMGVAPFGYALGMDAGPAHPNPAAVFLVARVAAGAGTALVFVGGYALITDVTTTENRGQWLGYMLGSYGIGFPVGMIAGGVVADAYGLQSAFLLAGVLGVVSVSIVLTLLPNRTPGAVRRAGIRSIPRLVRADRRVAVVGTFNGILKFLSASFLSTVVLVTADLGLAIGGFGDVGVGGVVLALSAAAAGGANLVAGRYSDTMDSRLLLTVPSLLVLAVGFVVVTSVPTVAGLVFGGVLIGIGGGAAGPVLFAFLGDISPSGDVGKLGGVFSVFGDLGGLLGPIIALPAVSSVGFETTYVVCAGIGVAAAVLVATTVRSATGRPDAMVSE